MLGTGARRKGAAAPFVGAPPLLFADITGLYFFRSFSIGIRYVRRSMELAGRRPLFPKVQLLFARHGKGVRLFWVFLDVLGNSR